MRRALANLQGEGGLNKDYSLNLLHRGAYSLVFDERKCISEVRHISGASAQVPKAAHLTTEHVLTDNFDDLASSLVLAPLPPIKLCSFFEKDAGPYAIPQLAGKHQKNFDSMVSLIFNAWEDTARRAMDTATADSAIVEGVKSLRQEAHHAAMARAREMAKEALSRKKASRCISLAGM